MTKKHFEALAAALRTTSLTDKDHANVSHRIADVCARFNPNFDRARFLKACGVEESK